MGRGAARLGPLLCLALAGCQALVPDIFEEDDCPVWNDRPLEAAFETSEGSVDFRLGQILLSAADDREGCYTSLVLTFRDSKDPNGCWMRIEAAATSDGLGVDWPVDNVVFAMRPLNGATCSIAPDSIRESYRWDRKTPGGYVRVNPPPMGSSMNTASCLREGIEIHLNARMELSSAPMNSEVVKEFWFPEQTYFMDDPLPVIEAFDCPF